MILKKSNFLFYILIVFTFAYAESELDTLIQEVYSGNIEKATSSIGRLKKEFPDNPALLFLEAMIDNNPEESIRCGILHGFIAVANVMLLSSAGHDDWVGCLACYFG